MIIVLARHAETESNIGKVYPHVVGDRRVLVTPRGHIQARSLGVKLGADFLRRASIFRPHFQRTRTTLDEILIGAGLMSDDGKPLVQIYEDPRLREVDCGYFDVEAQMEMRERHGWFDYRFRGGESPADGYDRADSFLGSMWRHIERKVKEELWIGLRSLATGHLMTGCRNLWRWVTGKSRPDVFIVCHGLEIRCFVGRFFHLTVEQFESMHNPDNCAVITIATWKTLKDPVFTWGKWGVTGLRLRKPEPTSPSKPDVMDM